MARKMTDLQKARLGVIAGMALLIVNLGGIALNIALQNAVSRNVALPLLIVHGLGSMFALLVAASAWRRWAALAAGQPPKSTDG